MKNTTRISLVKFATLIIIGFTAFSCAITQAPGGGPKDIKAPVLTGSEPGNNSVNFNSKKIILTFNEFVKLKNLEKFLLISPPMNEPPDIRENGKVLTIRIKDTLRKNTTYKFYLGDAIVDLNEGNPLRNFSFAFSTGPVIDSLTLSGKVTSASTLEPQKDVFVILHSKQEDSVPMLERPVYVTRTYDNGNFVFTNLASGKYRLIALKDVNGDYLYSPGAEDIAFADSLVEPEYAIIAGQDSVGRITLSGAENKPSELLMFSEPDSTQRLTKGSMTAKNQFQLTFRYPLKNLQLKVLGADSARTWCMKEFSANNDTMRAWLLPPVADTLRLQIIADDNKADTLVLATEIKVRESTRGKNVPEKSSLTFTPSTAASRYLELYKPFTFLSSAPLATLDSSMVRVISTSTHDTLKPQLVMVMDSIGRRTLIRHPWIEGSDYQILLPKGTATDIYGVTNDSLTFGFKVRTKDEYGLIRMNLVGENRPESLIFQLLTEKGVVVGEKKDTKGNVVVFDYLMPGKYRVKAIVDENHNGRWDTGSLVRRKQPEKVIMHPKTMDVRGNWELEEPWSF